MFLVVVVALFVSMSRVAAVDLCTIQVGGSQLALGDDGTTIDAREALYTASSACHINLSEPIEGEAGAGGCGIVSARCGSDGEDCANLPSSNTINLISASPVAWKKSDDLSLCQALYKGDAMLPITECYVCERPDSDGDASEFDRVALSITGGASASSNVAISQSDACSALKADQSCSVELIGTQVGFGEFPTIEAAEQLVVVRDGLCDVETKVLEADSGNFCGISGPLCVLDEDFKLEKCTTSPNGKKVLLASGSTAKWTKQAETTACDALFKESTKLTIKECWVCRPNSEDGNQVDEFASSRFAVLENEPSVCVGTENEAGNSDNTNTNNESGQGPVGSPGEGSGAAVGSVLSGVAVISSAVALALAADISQ